jgi:VanZ family protein
MRPPISLRRAWVALSLAYVALIFFVSSRPYLRAPGPEFDLKDKLSHGAEYLILGWLMSRAWRPRGPAGRVVTALAVVAVGATVAAADELFQGSVAGRVTDARDWLADVVGLLLGAAAGLRRRRGREKTETMVSA